MKSSAASPSRTQSRAYAEGWAVSVLFHLLGMIGAILLAANLKLPPQPTPFTWEIAMIEPSPTEPEIVQQPEPVRQPEPVKQAESVKQAEPVKQPSPKVMEPQPAVRNVQTRPVQPIAKPVTQQVHQVRQAVQPTARPIDQPKQTVQTARAVQSVQTTKVETIESQAIEAQTYSVSSTPAPKQTQQVITDPTHNIVEQNVSHTQPATITTKEAAQSNTEVASSPSIREQTVIEHTLADAVETVTQNVQTVSAITTNEVQTSPKVASTPSMREQTVIEHTPTNAVTPITQEIQTVSAPTIDEVETTRKEASTAPQFIEQAVIEDHSPAPVEQAVAQTQTASALTKRTIQTRTTDTTARETSPRTRQIVQAIDKEPKKNSTPVMQDIVTHNLNTLEKTIQSQHRTVTANTQSLHSREDYGWLAELLWNRIEQFKRYPAKARMRHWEGQVVLLAVITKAGEVTTVDVVKSSGYDVLDDSAIAALRLASPLTLNQHMKASQVAVQIPINYRLGR